jgi:hypothetical protein
LALVHSLALGGVYKNVSAWNGNREEAAAPAGYGRITAVDHE